MATRFEVWGLSTGNRIAVCDSESDAQALGRDLIAVGWAADDISLGSEIGDEPAYLMSDRWRLYWQCAWCQEYLYLDQSNYDTVHNLPCPSSYCGHSWQQCSLEPHECDNEQETLV